VAIVAGTGVGIASIQNKLDNTLDRLGDEIVQLSTVDPGASYGGKIIFQKVPFKKLPGRAEMVVDWNGHQYHLQFQIAKPGTPAPPFKPAQVFNISQPASAPEAVKNDAPPPSSQPQAQPQDQASPPAKAPDTLKT
jgi:hypothetical protein